MNEIWTLVRVGSRSHHCQEEWVDETTDSETRWNVFKIPRVESVVEDDIYDDEKEHRE